MLQKWRNPMKVLIFGGTRFMGRYVCREYLQAGHEVTIANRGSNEAVEGVRSISVDRSIPGAIDILHGEKFDLVIDFSAYPSAWVKEAGELLKGKISRYIFISSGAVYKKSNVFPIKEDFEVAPHELFYTYSDEKIKGEKHLKEFSAQGYFETVSCRLPYVMGIDNYEDREAFVLSRIINNRPVIVPNNGQAVLSFIYAGDVARALVALTMASSEVNGEAFNVAMPQGTTGIGFVDICAQVVGKEPRIHFINPNRAELKSENFNLKDMLFPFPDYTGFLDSSKLERFTGFVPQYNLKDCIAEFYQDMLKNGKTNPRSYELENLALSLLDLN
jgi:nucleoside-diphosphate-sugar epimerase